MTGSSTLTGTLTAQTLVVQTITSSISVITGSTQFGSSSANTHNFTGSLYVTGSTNFFAGSVGIGTITPTSKLTVNGFIRSYGNQTDIILNSTGSDQYSRVSYEENGVDKAQIQFINSSFANSRAGRLEICNAASGGQGIAFVSSVAAFTTPQMIIKNDGKVGIGTTTPVSIFHTVGTDQGVGGFSGTTYGIRIDNGGSYSSGMSTIHGTDSTLYGSYKPIMINGSDVRFGTSATERMRITGSNGYVGIGTTNPTGLLTISNPQVGSSIAATNAQSAYDYSSLRIKLYSESNVGLSVGYAGGNYTFIQTCYNEGTSSPLLLNPFNGSVGIGTNSPGTAALTVHTSGSGGGNAGNQIWIRGGNTNVTSNSNAIVFSYSDVALYSHAIKTKHNSAAINGNSIDFYVWNYGTDSSSTIGTRQMMSIDGTGVLKPSQPGFQVNRGNTADQSLANEQIVLQFNNVMFDTQGNYNTSTYRFTAPVAGRYLFTCQARYDGTTNTSGYTRTFFTINGATGTTAVYQYGHQIMGPNTGYSTNYQSGTISAVLQLAAGDYVQVGGGNTNGTNLQKESQFSGYLLG